jgi:hypothetical protein
LAHGVAFSQSKQPTPTSANGRTLVGQQVVKTQATVRAKPVKGGSSVRPFTPQEVKQASIMERQREGDLQAQRARAPASRRTEALAQRGAARSGVTLPKTQATVK